MIPAKVSSFIPYRNVAPATPNLQQKMSSPGSTRTSTNVINDCGRQPFTISMSAQRHQSQQVLIDLPTILPINNKSAGCWLTSMLFRNPVFCCSTQEVLITTTSSGRQLPTLAGTGALPLLRLEFIAQSSCRHMTLLSSKVLSEQSVKRKYPLPGLPSTIQNILLPTSLLFLSGRFLGPHENITSAGKSRSFI